MVKTLDGVDVLIQRNMDLSVDFCKKQPERRAWRTEHGEIAGFMCMDGRVGPEVFGAPHGVIRTWRNFGGKFNLAQWRRFQGSVVRFWTYANSQTRPLMFVVNDHFSRGDKYLGCRGHGYRADSSYAASLALQDEFMYFFKDDSSVSVPYITTETDDGALIFRGRHKSEDLDLGAIEPHTSMVEIRHRLKALYQSGHRKMPDPSLSALVKFATYSFEKTKEARARRGVGAVARPSEHGEWVLVVGSADWVGPNTALIVGPWDPDFGKCVKKAAGLLADNTERPGFDHNRGLVLMACTQYEPDGSNVGKRFAESEVQNLMKHARKIVDNVPQLRRHMQFLTGTLDLDTRKFNIVEAC